MIKTKEGTFYIVVNPFTQIYTVTVHQDSCTHETEMFYEQIDEWNEIQVGDQLYDVHVLYDQDFWIYITKVEEGVTTGCGESQEVQIEVQLHDGGPTTKLKRKQY